MLLQKLWFESTFVAIDLETTGKYPLDAEICEMAAVRWHNGQVTDTFQSLIKPTQRMSDEVIAIHHITNEMAAEAPRLEEKLAEFHAFIGDAFLIAHHAPFDMGFLSWEFEKARLGLPPQQAFCTSLLSQALNFSVVNHRLATLAEHFQISAGTAHRAYDDAQACLQVAIKYFEKLGPQATIEDIIKIQNRPLLWSRFSIEALTEQEHLRYLVRSLRDKHEVMITYNGGSKKGQPRRVFPLGLVRNIDGDFLVATDSAGDDIHPKRFFIEKISAVAPVSVSF